MASPSSSHTLYQGNDAAGTSQASSEITTTSTTELLEKKVQRLQNSVDSLVKLVSEQLPRLQLRQRALETKQAALEAKAIATRFAPAEHVKQPSDSLASTNNTGAALSIHTLDNTTRIPCAQKLRDSASITLAMTIQITNKSSIEKTFTHRSSATKFSTLYALRDGIVKTCSKADPKLCKDLELVRLVRDLAKVTYKLEEDGFAASLSLAPTRIDRACAFPESDYEAWFYRNVLRGNKAVYMVEVKIDI
jgi:hypothetical protein